MTEAVRVEKMIVIGKMKLSISLPSHISTGAILSRDVHIGASSFVGSGCIIKEGVTLGKGCVVGMGLSVRHNLANHVRFAGNDKT